MGQPSPSILPQRETTISPFRDPPGSEGERKTGQANGTWLERQQAIFQPIVNGRLGRPPDHLHMLDSLPGDERFAVCAAAGFLPDEWYCVRSVTFRPPFMISSDIINNDSSSCCRFLCIFLVLRVFASHFLLKSPLGGRSEAAENCTLIVHFSVEKTEARLCAREPPAEEL